MIEIVFLIVRGIVVAWRGQHDLVLENMALRQQLRMLQGRATSSPHWGSDVLGTIIPRLAAVAVRPRPCAAGHGPPLASQLAP